MPTRIIAESGPLCDRVDFPHYTQRISTQHFWDVGVRVAAVHESGGEVGSLCSGQSPLRPGASPYFPSPRLTGVPYSSNAATFTYPPEPWPLPGIKSTKPTSSTLLRSGASAQLEASPSGP